MELNAQVFTNRYCDGNSYVLNNTLELIESTLNTEEQLELFDQNYQNVIEHLMKNHNFNTAEIDDLKTAYLALLLDPSFKKNIQIFIRNGLTTSEALMAFYENRIINVLCPRISKEIFGLIRLLNQYSAIDSISIEPGDIIISNEITLQDWLNIDVSILSGVVLLNSSIDSHSSQIAQSLNIPLALIINSPISLQNFKNTFVVISSQSISYFPISNKPDPIIKQTY